MGPAKAGHYVLRVVKLRVVKRAARSARLERRDWPAQAPQLCRPTGDVVAHAEVIVAGDDHFVIADDRQALDFVLFDRGQVPTVENDRGGSGLMPQSASGASTASTASVSASRRLSTLVALARVAITRRTVRGARSTTRRVLSESHAASLSFTSSWRVAVGTSARGVSSIRNSATGRASSASARSHSRILTCRLAPYRGSRPGPSGLSITVHACRPSGDTATDSKPRLARR